MSSELPTVTDKHSRDYLLPGVSPSRDPRRLAFGELALPLQPRRKFTHAEVRDIRTEIASGMSDSGIAHLWRCFPSVIRDIRIGRTWRGVR